MGKRAKAMRGTQHVVVFRSGLGSSRRLSRALALILVASGLPALIQASPAQAALHNPIPADSNGDPQDQFVDKDALFAYMTSDIKGGEVCVIDATSNWQAQSCERPAWGTPNHVVGVGTIYTLLEAPSLVPGRWRLLATDSEGAPTAVSSEFFVAACMTCSTAIANEAVDAFKSAANQNLKGTGVTCIGMTVDDVYGTVTGAHGKVTKFANRATAYRNGDLGFLGALAGTVGGGVGLVFHPPDFGNPGEAKALEILHDLNCSLTAMYTDIVLDPPDPNFGQVAQPDFRTIDNLEASGATQTLAVSLDRQNAFGAAALTAFERYQGAQAAGDRRGVHSQATATADFAQHLANEVAATARNLRQYADVLDANPDFAAVVATDQKLADLKQVYARVRTDGFSVDELQQLHDAGYTDPQISDIRSQFDSPIEQLPANQTLQQIARDTADAIAATVQSFAAFAKEAWAVAGRVDSPPTGDFLFFNTGQNNVSGFRFGAIMLGTVSSPDGDAISSLEWDFGDGTPPRTVPADRGEFINPRYYYAAPGQYTVTLTVHELVLSTSVSHVETVDPPPAPGALRPFHYLAPGFTQKLYGTVGRPNCLAAVNLCGLPIGQVAWAPNGDPLIAAYDLYRFDSKSTVTIHGSTVHPLKSQLAHSSDCCKLGLTNGLAGSVYSANGYPYQTDGVARIDPQSGHILAGPLTTYGSNEGMTVDPRTFDIDYTAAGGVVAAKEDLSSASVLQTNQLDPASAVWDPTGSVLFRDSPNLSDNNGIAVFGRDGRLVQRIPDSHTLGGYVVGFAFHTNPDFLVTTELNDVLARYDFPNNDFTKPPVVSLFATGLEDQSLMGVGHDGCLYVGMQNTKFADGTHTRDGTGGLAQICGDTGEFFTPIPVSTTLTAKPAVARLVPPQVFLTLSATLTNDFGEPLTGQTIEFSAGGSSVCSGVTGLDGTASCGGLMPGVTSALTNLGYDARYTGHRPFVSSSGHGPLASVSGTSIPPTASSRNSPASPTRSVPHFTSDP